MSVTQQCGQQNCSTSFGPEAATTIVGRGLTWRPVQVHKGLVEKAQDVEPDGPGFTSQLYPHGLDWLAHWPLWGSDMRLLCGIALDVVTEKLHQ